MRNVPPGFCVTTDAFRRVVADASAVATLLDQLSLLHVDDRTAIRQHSAEIRQTIEALPIPDDLAVAIADALRQPGEHSAACAVRSSKAL